MILNEDTLTHTTTDRQTDTPTSNNFFFASSMKRGNDLLCSFKTCFVISGKMKKCKWLCVYKGTNDNFKHCKPAKEYLAWNLDPRTIHEIYMEYVKNYLPISKKLISRTFCLRWGIEKSICTWLFDGDFLLVLDKEELHKITNLEENIFSSASSKCLKH